MNDLTVFNYDTNRIRTIAIDGEPWFVLADLCKAIGIARKPAAVAERLDDGVRRTYPIQDSMGRTQQATIVSEAGMYEVVIRSDKPGATAFRRWVTHEVLPSIRKTGSYGAPAQLTGSELMAAALIEAQRTLEAAQERATRAEARIEADRPHTVLGRAVSAGDGDILVKRMADLLTQSGTRVSQNRLFVWLRANGWLCSNRGANWNAPTVWALDRGFVRSSVVVVTTSSGVRERFTPHITGAGQHDLIDGFTSGRYQIEGETANGILGPEDATARDLSNQKEI